ncbi:MerR family transcriptional regulator [Erwinia oleae]|uniref:MerR family transcriptional regulator n=1 Tax=Erwinia oleae TaxID=796334 RepID=UPI000550C067|nr:MerR family transcriptional regulator [Erwinia oleae]
MDLSIGEVSERSEVSVRAIRHYDKHGLVTSIRGSNGYRYFNDQSVTEVRQIRRLIAAGFTLSEICGFPACMRAREEAEFCPETQAALLRHLAEVEKHICALETQRAELVKALSQQKCP